MDGNLLEPTMEVDAILNILFGVVIAGIGWWLKTQREELDRLRILLNRTREEMAKEYVTKSDSSEVLSQIMNKFDRLEEKIDRLMER
jgi:Tfp pilus assembly protein PilO